MGLKESAETVRHPWPCNGRKLLAPGAEEFKGARESCLWRSRLEGDGGCGDIPIAPYPG